MPAVPAPPPQVGATGGVCIASWLGLKVPTKVKVHAFSAVGACVLCSGAPTAENACTLTLVGTFRLSHEAIHTHPVTRTCACGVGPVVLLNGDFHCSERDLPIALICLQHRAALPHCSGLYLRCDMQAVALANTVLMMCILVFFLSHTDDTFYTYYKA